MWFHVKQVQRSSLFSSFIAALEHWKWVGNYIPMGRLLEVWLLVMVTRTACWLELEHCDEGIRKMGMFHTPWKMKTEHTNHPFREENDLPNLHDYVPCYIIFRGVCTCFYTFHLGEPYRRLTCHRSMKGTRVCRQIDRALMPWMNWRDVNSPVTWESFLEKNGRSLVNWWYCWCKKSCITWDRSNMINLVDNGINYLSTG